MTIDDDQIPGMSDIELARALTLNRKDYSETFLSRAESELGTRGVSLSDLLGSASMRLNQGAAEKVAVGDAPGRLAGLNDWDLVVFNCLTLKGIYGREMFETWYKMRTMIQSGLDISPVITHRLHYTEFKKGFQLLRSGKAAKILLNWSE